MEKLIISSFPDDANPTHTDKFCVLSIHWNYKGESGCGTDKSTVYCNGKKIGTFTAKAVNGNIGYFALGCIGVNRKVILDGFSSVVIVHIL